MSHHWLIRVNDGKNFDNGIYPIWGVKRGKYNNVKTIIKKIKKGDILWFFTSKKYGAKFIAMAEYETMYDRADEPLCRINTLSNEEQNWEGDDDWDIQIKFNNIVNTRNHNISVCIQCAGAVLEYDTFKERLKCREEEDGNEYVDLYTHYKNFIYYLQ